MQENSPTRYYLIISYLFCHLLIFACLFFCFLLILHVRNFINILLFFDYRHDIVIHASHISISACLLCRITVNYLLDLLSRFRFLTVIRCFTKTFQVPNPFPYHIYNVRLFAVPNRFLHPREKGFCLCKESLSEITLRKNMLPPHLNLSP